jgi:rhamnogalacturonyl hydrolase YesR
MPNITKEIENSIDSLDAWITKNGWAGYDPYDIQCTFLLHKHSKKNKRIRFLHAYMFSRFNRYIPILSRKFLRVKPQINAKGMGLFTSAYSRLYSVTKNENYLKKAKQTAHWLLENHNKDYDYMCWGYPFDWQSLIFFPKGTPSGVATSHIGHGFWDLYEITKDEIYLNVCESIVNFFLRYLNRTKTENGFCFSYTPLDDFQVHNANLFVAEFIVRIGTKLKRKEWVDIGLEAANFSLSEQNENGALCYWSREHGKNHNIPCRNDHYHSGFEMRMIYNIWKWTKNNEYKQALDRYYKYYSENHFDKDYAPILTPKGSFNIDVHACAEALLLNSTLLKEYPEAKNILEKTANWIILNMQMKNGSYRYKMTLKRGKIKTNNVPYMRWGQAWMLLGLANALKSLK